MTHGRPSVLIFLAIGAAAIANARDVSVQVFGLFHPSRIQIQPVRNQTLTIRLRDQPASPVSWPDSLEINEPAELPAPADFVLRVPGRIERQYHGRLVIYQQGRELIPVLITDVETAVASIVAAESPPGSPDESLRAQAVVARSYLLAAGRRHRLSDFCDTTHCQFLREPPVAGSPSARASKSTVGIALFYQGSILEALYSADCGGRTRTLADARLAEAAYPYFAVECPVHDGIPSGHRIGLCQRGAAAMARSGATWRDILLRFFPGATVSASN